jgi:hypothetical protein
MSTETFTGAGGKSGLMWRGAIGGLPRVYLVTAPAPASLSDIRRAIARWIREVRRECGIGLPSWMDDETKEALGFPLKPARPA